MAIAFKDFTPLPVETRFFGGTTYEPLEAALERANEWMTEAAVRVVNIETVLLPNLQPEVTTSASGIRTSGDMASHWHQVIRVWYDLEEPPAAASAEAT
jgi:hypothetical protein